MTGLEYRFKAPTREQQADRIAAAMPFSAPTLAVVEYGRRCEESRCLVRSHLESEIRRDKRRGRYWDYDRYKAAATAVRSAQQALWYAVVAEGLHEDLAWLVVHRLVPRHDRVSVP